MQLAIEWPQVFVKCSVFSFHYRGLIGFCIVILEILIVSLYIRIYIYIAQLEGPGGVVEGPGAPCGRVLPPASRFSTPSGPRGLDLCPHRLDRMGPGCF